MSKNILLECSVDEFRMCCDIAADLLGQFQISPQGTLKQTIKNSLYEI